MTRGRSLGDEGAIFLVVGVEVLNQGRVLAVLSR